MVLLRAPLASSKPPAPQMTPPRPPSQNQARAQRLWCPSAQPRGRRRWRRRTGCRARLPGQRRCKCGGSGAARCWTSPACLVGGGTGRSVCQLVRLANWCGHCSGVMWFDGGGDAWLLSGCIIIQWEAQHSTAQHSTAQHSTAQHSTAPHCSCTAQPAIGPAIAAQCCQPVSSPPLPAHLMPPPPPLPLLPCAGVEQLSARERQLCTEWRLLPVHFLAIKDALMRDCERSGFVTRNEVSMAVPFAARKPREAVQAWWKLWRSAPGVRPCNAARPPIPTLPAWPPLLPAHLVR